MLPGLYSWLNGFNLHWAWRLLQREHAEASAAIEDCRCDHFSRMCRRHPAVRQQICLLSLRVGLQCPSLLQAYVSESPVGGLTGLCLVKIKSWKGTNKVQKGMLAQGGLLCSRV